jgi:hypothetical protein
MNQAVELTLEQEFNLRHFTATVQKMSCEQAQEFLIEQHKQMMIRETLYRELIKQEWKLDMDVDYL